VRDRALAGEFRTPGAAGRRESRDVLQGFAERCLSIVDVNAIKPPQVVLDGANGMAGTMLAPILERLPLDAERVNFEPDGTFPHYRRIRCWRRTGNSSWRVKAHGAPTSGCLGRRRRSVLFIDDTGSS